MKCGRVGGENCKSRGRRGSEMGKGYCTSSVYVRLHINFLFGFSSFDLDKLALHLSHGKRPLRTCCHDGRLSTFAQ